MRIRNWGPRTRAVACASSLCLAFGCSLQDFDPLAEGIGESGAGGDVSEAGAGGDGGSGPNGGNGGNGGSAGDGGAAGTAAGQGGAAGTGGGSGGSGGSGPTGGELMTDPSFETGLSGWQIFGPAAMTRVQTEARTGVTSLFCSSRDEHWNGVGFELTPLVSSAPDAQYTVSVWVRGVDAVVDGGAPATTEITMTLKTKCPGQTDTDAHYDVIGSAPLTDTWTLITGTTITPRRCPAPLDYRVYLAEPVSAVAPFPDYYVDDASFMLTPE